MAVAFPSPARIPMECGNSYLVSKLQWRPDLTLFNSWEGILKSNYRFQLRADPNSSPQISFSFQGALGHPAPFLWSFGSLSPLQITCISKYIRELLLSRSVMSNSFQPHGLQASRHFKLKKDRHISLAQPDLDKLQVRLGKQRFHCQLGHPSVPYLPSCSHQ